MTINSLNPSLINYDLLKTEDKDWLKRKFQIKCLVINTFVLLRPTGLLNALKSLTDL